MNLCPAKDFSSFLTLLLHFKKEGELKKINKKTEGGKKNLGYRLSASFTDF